MNRQRKYQSCSSRPNVAAYLHLPSFENGDIDLMEGFKNYDFHKMDYEALNNVLEFLGEPDNLHLLDDVEVVTRRGILTKIVNATEKSPFELLATKVRNVIYIAENPIDYSRSQNCNAGEYRGHKFEAVIFGGKWKRGFEF